MKRNMEKFKALIMISICVGIIYICSIVTVEFSVNAYKSLKEIFLPLLSVFVTAILSFMIWQANSKSALFAKKMQELELERENARIVETASKIHFTILDLYEYLVIHYKNQNSIRTMYICSDWIDEIARLKKVMSSDEIKLIFDLFRNMSAINDMKNEPKYQDTLDRYCSSLFLNDLLELSMYEQYEDYFNIIDYLTRDYLTVLTKLEELAKIQKKEQIEEIKKISLPEIIEKNYSNGQKKYIIDYKNSKMQIWGLDGHEIINIKYCQGEITGYMEKYKKGTLIEKGKYEKGKLIDGKRYNVYYDNNYESEDYEENEYIQPQYWDRYMKVQFIKGGKPVIDKSPENMIYKYVD